jgi:hypothetical protein
MLVEQEEYMLRSHPPGEKEVLRFKFDDALLVDLEALRAATATSSGGVSLLYNEIVALFPAGFMASQRLIAKLGQTRKKTGGGVSAKKRQKAESSDGSAKPVDVDAEREEEEEIEGSDEMSPQTSKKRVGK